MSKKNGRQGPEDTNETAFRVLRELAGIGFKFDKQQLFWLTAMPGLAARTLRIFRTFLIPVFGARKTISVSTLRFSNPCGAEHQ